MQRPINWLVPVLLTIQCLTSPSSAEATLVIVERLEVTQSIQSIEPEKEIPLVAGKRTAVRFYLSSNDLTLQARGWLRVESADGDLLYTSSESSALVLPIGTADLASRRKDATLSLNFYLEPKQMREGPLSLRLEQVVNATSGAILAWTGDAQKIVGVVRDAPLRLNILSIVMKQGNNASAPRLRDVERTESWLARAYPAGEMLLSKRQVATQTVEATSLTCRSLNAFLLALRQMDLAEGADSRSHYYGMANVSSSFKKGCALSVPQMAGEAPPIASGPAGEGLDSYAGHEIAHTFGAKHGDCAESCTSTCKAFIAGDHSFNGWDFGDVDERIPPASLPGEEWHDVTSYCKKVWPGAATYLHIRERLLEEDALPASSLTPPSFIDALLPAPYIHLSAFVDRDLVPQSVYLSPVYLSSLPQEMKTPFNVKIVGEGKPGKPIRVRSYRSQDTTEDYVEAFIPIVSGISAIKLYHNKETIFERPFGPSVPAVSCVSLARRSSSGKSAMLSWEGKDQDNGDLVTYAVQIGQEGGQWETVALGLEAPGLVLETDPRISSTPVLLRIIATDGYHSSYSVTNPLGGRKEDELPAEEETRGCRPSSEK